MKGNVLHNFIIFVFVVYLLVQSISVNAEEEKNFNFLGQTSDNTATKRGHQVRNSESNKCMKEEEGESGDVSKSELKWGKVLLLSTIGFGTFAASWLPWLIKERFKSAYIVIIAVSCCFSAGTITGAAFSHLLPDASESWTKYFCLSKGEVDEYPFAGTVAIFTMIFLLVLDRMAVSKGFPVQKMHSHVEFELKPVLVTPPPSPLVSQRRKTDVNSLNAEKPDLDQRKSLLIEETPVDEETGKPSILSTTRSDKDIEEQSEAHETDSMQIVDRKSAIVQAWIFFFALSVHSIFDGLGLGAEDKVDKFHALLISVLSHKLLDGFSVGVPVFLAQLKFTTTLLMFLFCSAMTPLGIGIGMILQETFARGAAAQFAKASIQSVTAGSFIFIAIIELLPTGLHTGPASLQLMSIKLFALFVGWAVMAILAIWI